MIATLEIFQHHFSEMGHGTPPVTHTYIKPSSNQRSTTSRVASAAGWLRSSPDEGSDVSQTADFFLPSANPFLASDAYLSNRATFHSINQVS